jgi:peptide/nickel transport system substrate-binding protein
MMTMRRKSMIVVLGVLLIAAVVAAVAAATASSSSPSAAASPAAAATPSSAPGKVTLNIGWPVGPDSLSPFIGVETASSEVLFLTYDRLFGMGFDGKPIPQLATEIPTTANGGISADGKTWTVKIRPGVKWQDGQPLTAADVAFSYNVIIRNGLTSFQQAVKGIKNVQAIDATTLRFTMSAPKADMLYVIVYIIPQHIWGKVKPSTLERSYSNRMPIIGSGPFQITEYQPGVYTKLVRNPDFWGNDVPGWGAPHVDQIVFSTYQNTDTMTQDLRAGTIDAAQGIPPAQFSPLQSTTGIKAIAYNYINWDFVDFNCYNSPKSKGNPVLRDPAFRVALDYAMDREKISQLVYDGRAKPGYTMITSNTWRDPDFHWEPPAGVKRPFDLAKASALLTAAGYPLKNGVRLDKQGKPITLRLWALTDITSSQTEGGLITGWLRQLGLKIVYQVVDNGVASAAMYAYSGNFPAPDYDMILWTWDGYWDPGSTLQCFTTSQIGSWNEVYWSNATYDKLCDQQGHEMNVQKRADLIHQMQQVMYSQNPQDVLTYFDYLQAVNTKKWTGWTPYYDANGPVFYNGMPRSYINVAPRTETAGANTGSSSTTVIIGVVAAVVVIAGLLVWWLRRRGGRAEED